MAVSFPAELDPDEELWMTVNWSRVLNTTEEIQTSLFELSSEAITDGLTIMSQDYNTTASRIKFTAGLAGTVYDILLTITTLDSAADTQKRQRTCRLTVIEK